MWYEHDHLFLAFNDRRVTRPQKIPIKNMLNIKLTIINMKYLRDGDDDN